MSNTSAQKPQQPGTPGPGSIGCGNAEAASTECQALLGLARLLGRQAARELILQQQRTDGSLNEPPVVDV